MHVSILHYGGPTDTCIIQLICKNYFYISKDCSLPILSRSWEWFVLFWSLHQLHQDPIVLILSITQGGLVLKFTLTWPRFFFYHCSDLKGLILKHSISSFEESLMTNHLPFHYLWNNISRRRGQNWVVVANYSWFNQDIIMIIMMISKASLIALTTLSPFSSK